MSDILDIAKKIAQLDINLLSGFAIDTIEEDDLYIIKDRMEQGLDADGSSFPPYSPTTLDIKRGTGGFISPTGNIAWKDTGGFYDSWKVQKYDGFAEIDSDDPIAAKIFVLAENVLDVSQEEANEMFENKRDEFIELIENFIFL